MFFRSVWIHNFIFTAVLYGGIHCSRGFPLKPNTENPSFSFFTFWSWFAQYGWALVWVHGLSCSLTPLLPHWQALSLFLCLGSSSCLFHCVSPRGSSQPEGYTCCFCFFFCKVFFSVYRLHVSAVRFRPPVGCFVYCCCFRSLWDSFPIIGCGCVFLTAHASLIVTV